MSGWNLSVAESLSSGSRGYMEDYVCNHIEKVNGKILFAVFGIFDGHGGPEAALFVKTTLVEELKRNSKFWSSDNDVVLIAIKEVYSRIQNLLWIEREKWPYNSNGYKSTAGTTASISVIRNDAIFIGHVGDSAIVLASQDKIILKSDLITKEHKPDDSDEMLRIEKSGGTLKRKAGILRIVWNKKKKHSNGEFEQIPFLAVARSLGDLWSYDPKTSVYHVSPEPDVKVIKLNPKKHRALILASDGVWNVMNGETSVDIFNACQRLVKVNGMTTINPAEVIVQYSLYQWKKKKSRSDNISVLVVKLVPDGFEDETSESGDNPRIISLQKEILANNLTGRCDFNQIIHELYVGINIEDFAPSDMQVPNNCSEDVDLLRMYIMSQEELSRHCVAWQNDVLYWEKLKFSFGQLGLPKLPNIIVHYDSFEPTLESNLCQFSWAVTCLKCASGPEFERIRSQPLLSEFWTEFYQKIISPNLCFTVDQLTQTSVYDTTMNHILTHKHGEIRSLVDGLLGPPISQKYSLKKSFTCLNRPTTITDHFDVTPTDTNTLAQNVYAHFQLQRSRSLQLTQVSLSPTMPTSLTSIFNSNSSTPILSPTRPYSQPTSLDSDIDHSLIFQKPVFVRRSSLSASVCRLSLMVGKRASTISERKLVRYVPRKKRKSN